GHTLQPTALVHEAYLRMSERGQLNVQNRAHFFAVAGRCMRQVLVDHARKRLAEKRGGHEQHRIEFTDEIGLTDEQSQQLLALDEALEQLEKLDARQMRIVELHHFAGNSIAEIAQILSLSNRTIDRELKTARLYLKGYLRQKTIR